MKVFITGSTGFIGRYVLDELRKRKHQILALSRKKQAVVGVRFIKGSLSNISKWKKDLARFKPDVTVHLAWEGIPDFAYELSVKNLMGGLELFSTVSEMGCKKIVCLGTGFEIGGQSGRVGEEIIVAPTSPGVAAIVVAKHALHVLGETLAKEKNFDFIWLRPFIPYGEGQRSDSLVPFIMRTVGEKTPLRLRSPFTQCDFIHVKDLARAIVSAVSRGKGQKTFNVGGGKLVSVREVAKIICQEMGADEAYIDNFLKTAKGSLIPAPYADIKSIKKEIGWCPSITIRQGLREAVRDFLK